jgi:DivIVA domain-containing protein
VALVWVLLAILVLGGVAVVAAGRGEGLPPADPDRPDLALPPEGPLVRSDVDQVRFSVGLRGYRMDEVDDVLDRLALDLEARDERIALLEREVAAAAAVPEPEPAATGAAAPDADLAGGAPAQASDEPTEVEQAPAGDDVEVGRTMIVPFQQTDQRIRPDDPADDDARGPGG